MALLTTPLVSDFNARYDIESDSGEDCLPGVFEQESQTSYDVHR